MKTIDEEIKINDQLNPALWDNNELKEDVKEKLLDIVDNFLDGLKEDKINISVVDIRLLGSNANYNYTDKSDIDLHIVADFSSTPCEQNVMPQLYNAYRSLFSKTYDIKVNGYDVELYVEDVNQPAKSNGVYSLYTGWISEPKKDTIPEINYDEFEKVFDEWEDKYFDIVGEHLGTNVNEDYANNIDKDILDTIKNPLDKLYKNTKCSKSVGTWLDKYFYEGDEPIKLCVGNIKHKGDTTNSKTINHTWLEVGDTVLETNFPDGDYERVLVDSLDLDRNEDLYNQVEEFLNKPSLREDLSQEVDSEGNPLTPEQVKFFKNSKVRDNKGRLLVVYHGTNEEFDAFDTNHSSESGLFGDGFYFTPRQEFAKDYGKNIKKCYLNITHPFNYYAWKDSEVFAILSKYNENFDKDEVADLLKDNRFNDDLDIIDDIISEVVEEDPYDNFSNILSELGYDGIYADDEIIAFNPNQIKSVDNKNPSSSDNINEDLTTDNYYRYEILEDGKLVGGLFKGAGELMGALKLPTETYDKIFHVIGKELPKPDINYNGYDSDLIRSAFTEEGVKKFDTILKEIKDELKQNNITLVKKKVNPDEDAIIYGDDYQIVYYDDMANVEPLQERKVIDLTGQQFGELTVLGRDTSRKGNDTYWLCKCSCGNEISVARKHLIDGDTKSCGHLKSQCGKDHTDNFNGMRDRQKKYHTNLEVIRNQKMQPNNTSGVKGVSYHNGRKEWRARVNVNGKELTKWFKDFSDAVAWRKNAEKKYYQPQIDKAISNGDLSESKIKNLVKTNDDEWLYKNKVKVGYNKYGKYYFVIEPDSLDWMYSSTIRDLISSLDRELNEQLQESNNYGYHAGDLGKSEQRERQTGGRNTGHFGTGTYFVGNPDKINGYNDNQYGKGKAPHHIVDFSSYNLYKPSTNGYGYKLHDALANINNGYKYFTKNAKDYDYFISKGINARNSGEFELKDIPEIVEHLNNLLGSYDHIDLPNDIDFNTIEQEEDAEWDRIYDELKPKYSGTGELFDAIDNEMAKNDKFKKVGQLVKEIRECIEDELTSNIIRRYKDHKNLVSQLVTALEGRHSDEQVAQALEEVNKHLDDKTGDSLSTIFMKALGYEGVDTRHLQDDGSWAGLDNTTYGSVIYDLKPETIVEGK